MSSEMATIKTAPAPAPADPTPVNQVISPSREVWLSMRANRGAILVLIVICLLVFCAAFPDVIAPHSDIEQFKEHVLQPPVWQDGGSWSFPLGTDAVGRCMLSRLIYGARLSLLIGAIVVTLSLALGIGFGLIGGLFRGIPEKAADQAEADGHGKAHA